MLARGHQLGQQPPLPGAPRRHCASLMQTILISTHGSHISLCNHHLREPPGLRRIAGGDRVARARPGRARRDRRDPDGQGHLVAAPARAPMPRPRTVGGRFASTRRRGSARGVSLSGVSLAGGLVYAERIVVPAHGLRGARVQGLTVDGAPSPRRRTPSCRSARRATSSSCRRPSCPARAAASSASGSSPATRRSGSTRAPSCWSGSPAPLSLPLATGTAARPGCRGSPSA